MKLWKKCFDQLLNRDNIEDDQDGVLDIAKDAENERPLTLEETMDRRKGTIKMKTSNITFTF